MNVTSFNELVNVILCNVFSFFHPTPCSFSCNNVALTDQINYIDHIQYLSSPLIFQQGKEC